MRRALVTALLFTTLGCGRAPEPAALAEQSVPAAPAAPAEPIAPATPAEPPVCALLDPEKDPLVALLEVKLLADSSAVWVERQNVDEILKEQQVQALFSPQGVGNRVALGKLLKARLLVLIRRVKQEKAEVMELILSETTSGIRLAHRAVAVTENGEAVATAMLEAVRQSLVKGRQRVETIVAVPPFLSQDLSFESSDRQAALARLAEAVALTRPGVATVELAEAEAVAKERALTAGGEALERSLPIYLLGEYRHEGRGVERFVNLKLRAERAGKPIGRPAELRDKLDDVPVRIRGWVNETLDSVSGTPAPPADPKTEAKQLAERAASFDRLANWVEAAALLDAACLIEPDNFELHMAALAPLTRIAAQINQKRFARLPNRVPPDAEVLEVRKLQSRAIRHLEAIIGREESLKQFRARSAYDGRDHLFFSQIESYARMSLQPTEAEGKLFAEARSDIRPLLMRVAPFDLYSVNGWFRIVFLKMSPKERYAAVEELVPSFLTPKNSKDRIVRFVLAAQSLQEWGPMGPLDDGGAYVGMLDRLATNDSPDVQAAARELRTKEAERVKKDAMPWTAPEKLAPLPVRLVEFVRESDGERVTDITEVLSIGTDRDLFWGSQGRSLYVMKTRGRVRAVWTAADEKAGTLDVCRDGRYVWALAFDSKRTIQLLVLDPETEKVHKIATEAFPQSATDASGIRAPQMIRMAPAGPGRVCLVGSFGRTWIATVTFDPTTGKGAGKVFHEAKEAQVANDDSQIPKTTIDFVPDMAFSISAAPDSTGKVERRVVIGRGFPIAGTGTANFGLIRRPLVVDPDRETVTVHSGFTDALQPLGTWFVPTEQTTFAVRHRSVSGQPTVSELIQLQLPDLTWKALGPARVNAAPFTDKSFPFALGTVVHNDRVHTIMRVNDPQRPGARTSGHHCEWWTMRTDGTGARMIGPAFSSTFLRQNILQISTHYGLVLGLVSASQRGIYVPVLPELTEK